MTKKKIDILVVDDSKVALKTMEKLLAPYALVVEYVADPEEALEVIADTLPKLLFIDYLMPKLTGVEVAIRFSELKLFKHCSLNLLSSKKFDETEIFSLMSLGYENVLKKPVSAEELESVLKTYFSDLEKIAA